MFVEKEPYLVTHPLDFRLQHDCPVYHLGEEVIGRVDFILQGGQLREPPGEDGINRHPRGWKGVAVLYSVLMEEDEKETERRANNQRYTRSVEYGTRRKCSIYYRGETLYSVTKSL